MIPVWFSKYLKTKPKTEWAEIGERFGNWVNKAMHLQSAKSKIIKKKSGKNLGGNKPQHHDHHDDRANSKKRKRNERKQSEGKENGPKKPALFRNLQRRRCSTWRWRFFCELKTHSASRNWIDGWAGLGDIWVWKTGFEPGPQNAGYLDL